MRTVHNLGLARKMCKIFMKIALNLYMFFLLEVHILLFGRQFLKALLSLELMELS